MARTISALRTVRTVRAPRGTAREAERRKHARPALLAAFLVLALSAVRNVEAASRADPAPAGQPPIEAAKEVGFFVWTDGNGLHLRWSSDGRPVLFTGSVELSRPPMKVLRVNRKMGGWMDSPAERVVMFSATASDQIDGADLVLEPGTRVKVDVQIDGEAVDVERVFVGKSRGRPASLPLRLEFHP